MEFLKTASVHIQCHILIFGYLYQFKNFKTFNHVSVTGLKDIEKHLIGIEREEQLPAKIVAISGLSLFLSMSITPGGKVSRFFSRNPVASYSTCGNPHNQIPSTGFLPSFPPQPLSVWRTSSVVFGLSS